MRKIKKVKVTKEENQTVDILCNMCGKSCNNKIRVGKKAEFVNYYGLIEVEVGGGYDSEVIGDLNTWRFSLCEHCLQDKVVSKFKIPHEVKDNDISCEFMTEKALEKKRKQRVEESKERYIQKLMLQGHKRKDLKKLSLKKLNKLYSP